MTSAPGSTSRATTALPRPVRVLVLARCVNRLGGFSMAFLGVLLVRELGAGPAETALTLTCFGVATIPSRLVGGHLADGWGHRRTMVLGLVGCAIAQLAVAGAPSVGLAAAAAALLGLAYEIVEPPTQALVSDHVPEPARAFAYSVLNASLAIAGVLAGLLATVVSPHGLRWLFVVDALTCLACAALVARVVDPDHQGTRATTTVPTTSSTTRATGWSRWRAALGDRRLWPVVAFGTVVATVTMVVVLGVPLLVEQRGWSPAVTGWVLAAGAAASVPGAWLAAAIRRRADERRVLLVGELMAAAGLVAIAAAHHPTVLAVGLVAFDVGGLLVLATTMARAGTFAPEGARGTYLALLGLTWGLATSVAPTLLALGAAHGPGIPFAAAAAALVVSAGVRAAHTARVARPTARFDPTLT